MEIFSFFRVFRVFRVFRGFLTLSAFIRVHTSTLRLRSVRRYAQHIALRQAQYIICGFILPRVLFSLRGFSPLCVLCSPPRSLRFIPIQNP